MGRLLRHHSGVKKLFLNDRLSGPPCTYRLTAQQHANDCIIVRDTNSELHDKSFAAY